MILLNKSQSVRHVETADGAVMFLPEEQKDIDDSLIVKSEFGRIEKLFTVIERSKPQEVAATESNEEDESKKSRKRRFDSFSEEKV